MIIVLGAICLVSYLFGSFPAGYLAGRAAGVDVRQHGSGNIGATNVLRVLGKPYGYAVFFVDALKGFLAVRLAIFAAYRIAAPHPEYFGITAAALAIVGHTFPVWHRARGSLGAEGTPSRAVGTQCGASRAAANHACQRDISSRRGDSAIGRGHERDRPLS